MGAITVAVGMMLWRYHSSIEDINGTLRGAKPYLLIWRVVVLVGLIGYWPWLMSRLGAVYAWPAEGTQRMIAQRWRIATLMVAVDLLLVEDGIGFLMRWI